MIYDKILLNNYEDRINRQCNHIDKPLSDCPFEYANYMIQVFECKINTLKDLVITAPTFKFFKETILDELNNYREELLSKSGFDNEIDILTKFIINLTNLDQTSDKLTITGQTSGDVVQESNTKESTISAKEFESKYYKELKDVTYKTMAFLDKQKVAGDFAVMDKFDVDMDSETFRTVIKRELYYKQQTAHPGLKVAEYDEIKDSIIDKLISDTQKYVESITDNFKVTDDGDGIYIRSKVKVDIRPLLKTSINEAAKEKPDPKEKAFFIKEATKMANKLLSNKLFIDFENWDGDIKYRISNSVYFEKGEFTTSLVRVRQEDTDTDFISKAKEILKSELEDSRFTIFRWTKTYVDLKYVPSKSAIKESLNISIDSFNNLYRKELTQLASRVDMWCDKALRCDGVNCTAYNLGNQLYKNNEIIPDEFRVVQCISSQVKDFESRKDEIIEYMKKITDSLNKFYGSNKYSFVFDCDPDCDRMGIDIEINTQDTVIKEAKELPVDGNISLDTFKADYMESMFTVANEFQTKIKNSSITKNNWFVLCDLDKQEERIRTRKPGVFKSANTNQNISIDLFSINTNAIQADDQDTIDRMYFDAVKDTLKSTNYIINKVNKENKDFRIKISDSGEFVCRLISNYLVDTRRSVNESEDGEYIDDDNIGLDVDEVKNSEELLASQPASVIQRVKHPYVGTKTYTTKSIYNPKGADNLSAEDTERLAQAVADENKPKDDNMYIDSDEGIVSESTEVIPYDFSGFRKVIIELQNGRNTAHVLTELKQELNKFFNDSICKQVIFTNNTDKMFFGMYVYPLMKYEDIVAIATNINGSKRIPDYTLELDSQLFDFKYNLTVNEILSMIIHEVGHMVGDDQHVKELENFMNAYQAKKNIIITPQDVKNNAELFKFGIIKSLRLLTSVFELRQEEYFSDDFAQSYGFAMDLETAFDKVVRTRDYYDAGTRDNFIVAKWVLKIFKEVRIRKQGIRNIMDDAEVLTGSVLEKDMYNKLNKSLNNIFTTMITESVMKSSLDRMLLENNFFTKLKSKSMRVIEQDVYEFSIKVKNIETESEAVVIMRDINMRIGIIEDYLNYNKLPEMERERWESIKNKYYSLRDELVNNPTYRNKFFGLFVEVPVVRGQVKSPSNSSLS